MYTSQYQRRVTLSTRHHFSGCADVGQTEWSKRWRQEQASFSGPPALLSPPAATRSRPICGLK